MKDRIPFPIWITGLVFLGTMANFVGSDTHLKSIFEDADNSILLLVNESHTRFWDAVMKASASFYFWLPLYCFFLLRLIAHERVRFLRIIIFILFYISISIGTLSLYNANFAHLAPLYNQAYKSLLTIGASGPGDAYGCIPLSSVAAGLAFMLGLFFGKGHLLLNIMIGLWAFLVAFSSLYNTWNYPREILSGSIFCLLLGYLSYSAYRIYLRKNYAA